MKHLLSNLRLSRKMALLGAAAALAAAIPLALFVGSLQRSVSVTEAERLGIAPAQAALEVVRLMQQHRGLSAVVLNGKLEMEDKRSAKQDEVERAVVQFDAIVRDGPADERLAREWAQVRDGWRALARDVGARAIDGAQSLQRHSDLIALQIEVADRAGDVYGLTYDADPATHFLLWGTLKQAPRLAESLGLIRARGSALLARQSASPDERAALSSLVDRTNQARHELDLAVGKALDADGALRPELDLPARQAAERVDASLALAREKLIDAAKLDFAPADFFGRLTESIDGVYALNRTTGEALRARLDERIATARRTEFALLAVVLVISALLAWVGWVVCRGVIGAAQAACDAAGRIARGNLAADVPVTGRDELGLMLASMRAMQASLHEVVEGVRHSSESVATASAQIAQSNQDLSTRTESQASSLQETAASMEQLTAAVKTSADSARQASQLAAAASDAANRGGGAMTRVVETIAGINSSSQRMAEIIGVIDGIAFQTNILALNAAVEAARAGEQGRGFAVVAGEVRTLAQRSAQAAREIKDMIQDSIQRVGDANHLVTDTGASMSEMWNQVKRVADLIGEITSSSQEQSSGIAQVNEAVMQMDHVTQQNAALVEEVAAAATSLREQSDGLVRTVAVFDLGDGRARGAVARTMI